jgi:hypothetical protein
MRLTRSLTQPVYCPNGSQPSQQCREVSHILPPGNLQSANECFLEAVGCVRVITKQPVRGLPYERAVCFYNYLPINWLQATLLINALREAAIANSLIIWNLPFSIIIVEDEYFLLQQVRI